MTIENLLVEFKTYKVDVEGRDGNSIDLYIKNFNQFCKDMQITNYEQLICTKANTIKMWLSQLAQNGNQATTRNNKLASVKQVFVYLENERDIEIDRKINNIKVAKVEHKETHYVDEMLFANMLQATTNLRTRALINILFKTGLRISEVKQLTCTDIDRGYAIIKGKGKKERYTYFSQNVISECRVYITRKRNKIVEKFNLDTDILFLTDKGGILKDSNTNATLTAIANKVGVYWAKEMSPHKFRHGCITNALDKGVPINVVRDIAGHSNMSTTNTYAHSTQDAIKEYMLRDKEDNE